MLFNFSDSIPTDTTITDTPLPDLFTPRDVLLSSILCALAIILFFVLSWLIKKLFKKNTNKGLAILNLSLNVLLAAVFIISVLFILGLDISALITRIKDINITTFITDNISKVISIILVIVVASIIMSSFVAIIKATKARRPEDAKRKRTLDKVIISIVRYIIIIASAVAILFILGVNVIPALAGLGIAGLVLGLGAQKLITDFISGLFIILEHHFDVGDIIEVGGFKGEVIDLGLKTTKIRNWQGQIKILSNSEVTNLINCSLNDTVFSTSFDISYQADVEKAIEVVNKELPIRLKNHESIISYPVCNGVSGLTSRSVTLNVVATAKNEAHYQLTRDINTCIKGILTDYNIKFPGDSNDWSNNCKS